MFFAFLFLLKKYQLLKKIKNRGNERWSKKRKILAFSFFYFFSNGEIQ